MTPLIDSLRTARASQTGKILDAKTLALLLAEIDGLVGVKDAPLTIEVGKCYRTRDGQKAGPIEHWNNAIIRGPVAGGEEGNRYWNRSDGTHGDRDDVLNHIRNIPQLDLVAEWIEPAPATDPAPATPAPVAVTAPAQPLKVELGRFYLRRDGAKEGPIIKSNMNEYPFLAVENMLTWRSDGQFGNFAGHQYDLVAEWIEPAAAEPALLAPDAAGPKAVVNDLKGKWEQTGPNTYRGHLTPAPDYNDGEIHIWRGGECPVHPDSEVKVWFRDGEVVTARSGDIMWDHSDIPDSDIIAFQVTRPHVEPVAEPAPLECWVNVYENGDFGKPHARRERAIKYAGGSAIRTAVHMREVAE